MEVSAPFGALTFQVVYFSFCVLPSAFCYQEKADRESGRDSVPVICYIFTISGACLRSRIL